MIKIGLISDTHSFLDEPIVHHLKECKEIWHAGDIGNIRTVDFLKNNYLLRAVYGNIDGREIRNEFKEYLVFEIEELKVVMIHIAGRFGKYNVIVQELIEKYKPKLLICGHSHILKIAYDKKQELLYVNPGACGIHGFHPIRTLVRFDVDEGQIKNMEIIELSERHPKMNLIT